MEYAIGGIILIIVVGVIMNRKKRQPQEKQPLPKDDGTYYPRTGGRMRPDKNEPGNDIGLN